MVIFDADIVAKLCKRIVLQPYSVVLLRRRINLMLGGSVLMLGGSVLMRGVSNLMLGGSLVTREVRKETS